MRVLFSAHGAYGHVLPLVGLGRALQDVGHDVQLATGEELCPVVTALGLPAVAAGIRDADMVAEARSRWPDSEHEPPASWAARMFTDIAAPVMAADLARVIASWRPNLVVREQGEYGAAVAAAAAGVRYITHGWGSPLPSAAQLNEVAGGLAPLWGAAGLAAPQLEDLRGIAVLDLCPQSLYGAERRAVAARPMRPATADVRAAEAIDRLPTEPLAYVGFGTVALYRDRPKLITMAVRALLAAGFSALVTTPDAELAGTLRGLDTTRVRVEEWVSLPQVLSSCRLVVTHGGAGSVLAALAAGLPLLLLPGGSPSQLRMSQACARRGVALAVGPRQIESADLDAALTHLTVDDGFRAAARQVAAEIASMPAPRALIPLLESLATGGSDSHEREA